MTAGMELSSSQEGELRAQELSDEASRLATETRQAMARLIEEQPILVAALGTAIGAPSSGPPALKDVQLGEKAGQAMTRLVDATASVPKQE
jgi:hypothetical protein